ncbi:MAG: hypothetical protein E7559_09515 [Ruminococcaceae bacterium]|nr:hypothetical protein [Oscillospiraceae bacterium]
MSEGIRKRYADMYSGIFYRRYVLGEWCAAEGLVYPMFERECHITESSPPYDRCFLSCDYGTHNPFALGLVSVRHTEKGLCYRLEREFYHDGRKAGQLTDSQYADRLVEFNGGEGAYVVVDPSASSFIAELRRRGIEVRKASNDVHEGIRCVAAALTEGRLTVSPACTNTIREFSCYSWDIKAAEHGEDRPVKQNDHAMDMLRYALYSDRRMDGRKERYSGRGIRG